MYLYHAVVDRIGVRGEVGTARYPRANFTLKLVRPGFGPAAELPTPSASAAASRRLQFVTRCCAILDGNRRAAPASVRGTGRTA